MEEQTEEIFADEDEGPSSSNFNDIFTYYVDKVRYTSVTILEFYGWYLLLLAVLLYFVWRKYKQQLVPNPSDQTNDVLLKKYDQNELYERQERMLQARLKMQEQQNRLSEEYVAKMKQKEEEIRQRKIDEYQQFVDGKGYHNKTRVEENQTVASKDKLKTTKKSTLKSDDYNPLMGHGGSSGYRPSSRRGGSGGGGG